ncbi:hypothetical protein BOTBODRAFT_44356 [Botryobasidium botryosum FD-172 SS1]|uniref:F-box domain-containing protein n=1 Tax=Botryobasidium botryosum (strain FD-172 SS1) TaxID=930990 RepID=A0A067MSN8_BOTB1|nr:hypothetical protein BOTBODRAFT_44356 [Botryobasidium botryosum FD-172 SS1]
MAPLPPLAASTSVGATSVLSPPSSADHTQDMARHTCLHLFAHDHNIEPCDAGGPVAYHADIARRVAYACAVLDGLQASPAAEVLGDSRIHDVRPRYLALSAMTHRERNVTVSHLQLTSDTLVKEGPTSVHLLLFLQHFPAAKVLHLERIYLRNLGKLSSLSSLRQLMLSCVAFPRGRFAELVTLLEPCRSLEELAIDHVSFEVDLPQHTWDMGNGNFIWLVQIPSLQKIKVAGLSSASLRTIIGAFHSNPTNPCSEFLFISESHTLRPTETLRNILISWNHLTDTIPRLKCVGKVLIRVDQASRATHLRAELDEGDQHPSASRELAVTDLELARWSPMDLNVPSRVLESLPLLLEFPVLDSLELKGFSNPAHLTTGLASLAYPHINSLSLTDCCAEMCLALKDVSIYPRLYLLTLTDCALTGEDLLEIVQARAAGDKPNMACIACSVFRLNIGGQMIPAESEWVVDEEGGNETGGDEEDDEEISGGDTERINVEASEGGGEEDGEMVESNGEEAKAKDIRGTVKGAWEEDEIDKIEQGRAQDFFRCSLIFLLFLPLLPSSLLSISLPSSYPGGKYMKWDVLRTASVLSAKLSGRVTNTTGGGIDHVELGSCGGALIAKASQHEVHGAPVGCGRQIQKSTP